MQITGSLIKELGYQQAAWWKNAIGNAGTRDFDLEEARAYLDEFITPTAPRRPQGAVPWFKNIEAKNEAERANVEAVSRHMDELMRVPTIVAGAVMPDACPSEKTLGFIPVGGVVAAKEAIHPGMHSADICCSMAISVFGDADPTAILDAGMKYSHFGAGGRKYSHDMRPSDDLLRQFAENRFLSLMTDAAINHFGTQGDGNHFFYVGRIASSGQIALVTHHGSRKPGALLYAAGMDVAERFRKRLSPETPKHQAWIPSETDEGRAYWDALQIVRTWTKKNHYTIHDTIAKVLGLKIKDRFWNEHNFCIAGDQLVQTTAGPVKMRDISDGCEIYAFDRTAGLVKTKVLKQWKSGSKPIFRIKTHNRSIRVSGDHPIQVIDVAKIQHPTRPWMFAKSGSMMWKRAADISIGDIVVCAEGTGEASGDVWSLDLARFVGAYLGDGWCRARPAVIPKGGWHTVGLAIGAMEDAHTELYRNLLERLFPKPTWRNNGKGAFGLTCTSRAVWEEILRLGMSGTSATRRMPRAAFTQPIEQKLAILAGYFDSDGTIYADYSNRGQGLICAANECLVRDLRELAISCGMRATSVRHQNNHTNFGRFAAYYSTIGADGISQLPLWHQEKASKQRHGGERRKGLHERLRGYVPLPENVFAQTVQSIDIEPEEEVFDLTVDHPSHSFVCEGIVVHNCFRRSDGLFYHAKGATPAYPYFSADTNGLTLIPLNMAEPILITRGLDAQNGLGFSPHGAGRNFSRTAYMKANAGKTDAEMIAEQAPGIDVRYFCGIPDVSELPGAYKNAASMRRQIEKFGLAEVVDTIEPIGNIMAGQWDRDAPWRKKKTVDARPGSA